MDNNISIEVFLGDDDHAKLIGLGAEPSDDVPGWVGDSMTVELPARWIVCPECDGQGVTHLGWRSNKQPAYTQMDFDEDPDLRENLASGAYDKPCPECQGRTTIRAVDEGAIDKMSPLDQHLYKLYLEQLEMDAYWRRVEDNERKMGA